MIYLDHAAATPVDERVLEAMKPYFSQEFFNPSAAYLPAKKVASDYEAAKAAIAHAIGTKASDLVMTAGATEANNLALGATLDGEPLGDFSGHAVAPAHRYGGRAASTSAVASGDPQKAPNGAPSMSHHAAEIISGQSVASGDPRKVPGGTPSMSYHAAKIISGQSVASGDPRKVLGSALTPSGYRVLYLVTEHDSVRRAAERCGGVAVKVLPSGVIDLDDLRSKITDDTELISVSLVNNEIGTIQPLAEIASMIREIKLDRLRRGIKRQLLLHSDASQALNLLDINVARLGVDLMTLNAAKIYGPKGVGALYVSHEVRLSPLTVGGGQERGLRSGTENVPGVVGFARATELAHEHLGGNRKKYAAWRKILLSELQGYELVNRKHCLDNFVVLCYNGIDAERLVFLLEDRGIYVSTGAACAASKGVRSHVLAAIGLSDTQIAGSLRLTLGETNDEAQIHEAARVINEVVTKERERING